MKNRNNILKNKMSTIICNHCNKKIISPELVGLTLVCPHCKKSVNGQYQQLQQESEQKIKKIKTDSKQNFLELY